MEVKGWHNRAAAMGDFHINIPAAGHPVGFLLHLWRGVHAIAHFLYEYRYNFPTVYEFTDRDLIKYAIRGLNMTCTGRVSVKFF